MTDREGVVDQNGVGAHFNKYWAPFHNSDPENQAIADGNCGLVTIKFTKNTLHKHEPDSFWSFIDAEKDYASAAVLEEIVNPAEGLFRVLNPNRPLPYCVMSEGFWKWSPSRLLQTHFRKSRDSDPKPIASSDDEAAKLEACMQHHALDRLTE